MLQGLLEYTYIIHTYIQVYVAHFSLGYIGSALYVDSSSIVGRWDSKLPPLSRKRRKVYH